MKSKKHSNHFPYYSWRLFIEKYYTLVSSVCVWLWYESGLWVLWDGLLCKNVFGINKIPNIEDELLKYTFVCSIDGLDKENGCEKYINDI